MELNNQVNDDDLENDWSEMVVLLIDHGFRMLSVRTAEEEGYNLLTVLLERGLIPADHDPWKLLLTALQKPSR